jgi:molybdopterin molybdotransferase
MAVLAVVRPLPSLPVALADAHGCLLAEEVSTAGPLPPAAVALVDGYAVRHDDVAAASPQQPASLLVVGDAAPGVTEQVLSVQPGCAVRVTAGALLPPGTEAVVPAPWTDNGLARVLVSYVPEPGGYLRPAGSDLPAGAVVLRPGTLLGPAQVGLLAATGRAQAVVHPRPRVVVVATSRGLVEVGQPCLRGQTVDAGSHLVAASVREAGGVAFRVGVLPEDPGRLLDALEDHLIRADLVIATGGASGARPGGAGHVMAEVLRRIGTVTTARVALHPGGSFAVGAIGPDAVPFLGLPGHPVAALVGFALFGRPAVRVLQGLVADERPPAEVVLTHALVSPPGLRHYVPVHVEPGTAAATAVGRPGVHPLGAFGTASALAVLSEDATDVVEGTRVPAIWLERRRGSQVPS